MQASAQAQPNIALVKYWGKRDHVLNLPAVGSLSLTLDSLWTRMSVSFEDIEHDVLEVNGADATAMLPRVSRCLDLVAGEERRRARIISESNFPIAAGLASSASAFAALVVAANEAAETGHGTRQLARLAGAASGSAARSVFGGFVQLTPGDAAIEVEQLARADDWPLQVIVALTNEDQKPIGSSEAMMRSEKSSPFYQRWIEAQALDLGAARDALFDRNFAVLSGVCEHNCLKMHSLTWTSRPPVVYWNAATVSCLETVRTLQAKGHGVFFTMDAGPQVKAVCLPESAAVAKAALEQTPGVIRVMSSGLGDGARVLKD